MEAAGESTRAKTRIFVGGLGGGVTEDDLRKTFSALGEVVAVDVVRTKGRGFAYLDFIPSSDKSLPKLFSTYNGCMWKGGKLRLEKAKEHYFVRLRREWQEESTNSSKASDSCNTDPSDSHNALENPKKFSPIDKTQLCIFFPKLGKVKSLAQVGIGKHKYSFQRIPVPTIPTHFCDCEEHSLAFIPTKKKQSFEVENANDGINEQELEIMNSVMKKIFEKANPCKQETKNPESVDERGVSMNSDDKLVSVEDDEEDHFMDEDNLIINVATGSDAMDLSGEMRTMMAKQELLSKSVDDNRKKKSMPLSKKRKSLHTEENDGNNPETSRNLKKSREGQVESGSKQSGGKSLRSLKSTWKDLIGQKGSTPFSISDIISPVPLEEEKKKLVGNKRKLEADKTENTSSKLPVNIEPTPEVGAVIAEITTPNDSQQKRADLEADSQKTHKFDVLPEQKEEDDLVTSIVENKDNNQSKDGDEDLIRTARGEAWRHKSSWTQLINTFSHTSFSISQIVPDITSEKPEDTFDSQLSNKSPNTSAANTQILNTEKTVKNKNTLGPKKSLPLWSLESEETCPFMRTEESMKEWKKAKASLSGSLNKKKSPVNESA